MKNKNKNLDTGMILSFLVVGFVVFCMFMTAFDEKEVGNITNFLIFLTVGIGITVIYSVMFIKFLKDDKKAEKLLDSIEPIMMDIYHVSKDEFLFLGLKREFNGVTYYFSIAYEIPDVLSTEEFILLFKSKGLTQLPVTVDINDLSYFLVDNTKISECFDEGLYMEFAAMNASTDPIEVGNFENNF